jgi:Mrp family chromosome partitioning ATPase
MREVDEALARAYSQPDKGEPARGVPPAPHWPAHAAAGAPAQEAYPVPSRSRAAAHESALVPGDSPATDFALGTEISSAGPLAELQWPAVVLGLERDWGDRFDRLAERLIEGRRRQNLRAILFTSCHRAEGRTTLVLTLARALARHSGRTVLVDADLAGPMLARLLGLRPEVGLDDVVEGGHALPDALIDAPDDHLSVLPIRSAVARPRDFLASPAWTCTLARLRREFDLILLDGGPLFTGLSAAVLHRSVDAAVLVYHRELTGERALLRAREALEAGGVPLLGLAETFV